jgi:hypothetical protein
MTASAVMVDLSYHQNITDEIAIDYSKLEKVKSNLDLIMELFSTCIEFGKTYFSLPFKILVNAFGFVKTGQLT